LPFKNRLSTEEIEEQKRKVRMDAVNRMTGYYRANPHRFIGDYFNGINLKWFQKVLIYMMNWSNFFLLITSRGLGKTFLTALFCCVRCILYPHTKICIASGTRSQGNEVLSKVDNELRKMSPNLNYEIESISIGANKGEIIFKNGSWIKVVTASDSARGNRANVIFVDEFVKTDRNVIDTVLKKFLTAPRHCGFMDKPEYKEYPVERNKELYASSAWLKSHWSYQKLKTYVAQMLDDSKRYFTCGLPYQIAIKEGLLSREQVEDEVSEDDFDELTFSIEMGALWYGDNEDSFFSLEKINNQRVLTTPYPKLEDVLSGTTKVPPLVSGERRILSVDVALMASTRHNNDATSIIINSAIPNNNGGFQSNYVYLKNYEGLTTNDLGLKIMQMFYLYKCTDLTIDTNGVGLGTYDYIVSDHYDPETNMTYGAMTTRDASDPMASRCKAYNALPCVWSIKANASFNSDIALMLRNDINVGKINMLVDEYEAERNFNESSPKYRKAASAERVDMKMPFIETTLLVNEMVNLKYAMNGTNVRLHEKNGMRKDRYSSLAYNNWTVNQIIQKNKKNRDYGDFDISQFMKIKKPKLRKL
jgi:hypothetical protein